MTKPKLMIIGHARHGKDTVSEILRDRYGFTFVSSSYHCAENLLFPMLKDKYGYKTVDECYADRSNHRAEWFDAIKAFNYPDLAAMGRDILYQYDIYCGLRNKSEFHALRNAGVFDVSIWIDASDRQPPESKDSCTVEPWMADYILDNNGTIEDLIRNVRDLVKYRLTATGQTSEGDKSLTSPSIRS